MGMSKLFFLLLLSEYASSFRTNSSCTAAQPSIRYVTVTDTARSIYPSHLNLTIIIIYTAVSLVVGA